MLSIFTELTSAFPNMYFEKLKQYIEKKYRGIPKGKYTGHYAVTRSLIEGLNALENSAFEYNPSKLSPEDHVHVLAGIEPLKAAIKLKEKGLIKRLTAGPNIVVLPSDDIETIASPHIDTFLVNSKWTFDSYTNDCPILREHLKIWPAGVEINNLPTKKDNGKTVLFYIKRIGLPVYEPYVEACRKLGYQVELLHYGSYTMQGFRNQLSRTTFACFFSESESQGLALAETWAMDVPTFVWSAYGFMIYKGQKVKTEPAPYLTEETGMYFSTPDDLIEGIKRQRVFSPRRTVIEQFGDEICAEQFLNLILEG